MPRIKKKSVAVLIAMVVAFTGLGVAYAYWTSDGTGSGTAETGTSQDIVINQTSDISGMGPGVAAQELSGTFDNPGPTEATVTTVTASISSISGAGPGGCTADDYVLTGAAMTVAGNPIAVGVDVGAWGGATIAFLSSATTNQDGCKGATVNLAYVAS